MHAGAVSHPLPHASHSTARRAGASQCRTRQRHGRRCRASFAPIGLPCVPVSRGPSVVNLQQFLLRPAIGHLPEPAKR